MLKGLLVQDNPVMLALYIIFGCTLHPERAPLSETGRPGDEGIGKE
jgi:hypothetical protein